ncbi:MAG: OmpA family protein [Kangiellaceae bacterium]|nr:OmpA family protein [Kangiellaceae bacterium]
MSILKMGKSLVIVASATLIFGCAGTDTKDDTPVEPVDTTPAVVVPEAPKETEEARALRMNKEARQAAGSTVYFELDEDVVSSKGRSILEAHAWFLSQPANANTVIAVDGHCDERGTPAYNLALGERRAKAVAQILMSYGVSSSQIKTVSHGEESPANPGHDESAWSENRRAVLDYAE